MRAIRFELSDAEVGMLERVVGLPRYYGCSPRILFVRMLMGVIKDAQDVIDVETRRAREARLLLVDEALASELESEVAERRYKLELAMFPGEFK